MDIRGIIEAGILDIKAHKVRSFLATLGVILGVSSVIVSLALVDGRKKEALRFIAEKGGIREVSIGNKYQEKLELRAWEKASKGLTYEDALAIKKECKLLEAVDPEIESSFIVQFGAITKEMEITGVTPDYQIADNFYPQMGRFITYRDLESYNNVCVLGTDIAEDIFGKINPIGQEILIGGKRFTVVGIMEEKEYYLYSKGWGNQLGWMNELAFMPITTMMKRFTGTRKINQMECIVKDVYLVPRSIGQIKSILLKRHRGIEDFELGDALTKLRQMLMFREVYDKLFLVIGTISLVLGGVVIMNILLASITERTREIGIQKSIGANEGDIFSQFFLESLIFSMAGGVLGILLGLILAKGFSFLILQPVTFSFKAGTIAFLLAVVVGIFFGIFPAIRASRLNPIDALRCE